MTTLNIFGVRAGKEITCEVEADIIELREGLPFKFGVWRKPDLTYQVAECSTGRMVAEAPTRKSALNEARKRLRAKGMAKMDERIAHWPTLNESFAMSAIEPAPDGPYCEVSTVENDYESCRTFFSNDQGRACTDSCAA